MDNTIQKNVSRFWEIITEQEKYLFEMREYLTLIGIGIIAKTNLYVIGDVGMAKSMGARDWTKRLSLDATSVFTKLVTKFTTEDELMGAPSLRELAENDRILRNTSGMLPEAYIACLDEVGKASSAILNVLLQIMAEREYTNGGTTYPIPLRTLIGTSNEELSTELRAFNDRFVLRYEMCQVRNRESRKALMNVRAHRPAMYTQLTAQDVEDMHQYAMGISFPEDVMEMHLQIIEGLERLSITPSARRIVEASDVVRVYAMLHGHDEVKASDLGILRHIYWWEPSQIETVSQVVLEVSNPMLYEVRKADVIFSDYVGKLAHMGDRLSEQEREKQEALSRGDSYSVSKEDYVSPANFNNLYYEYKAKMSGEMRTIQSRIKKQHAQGEDVGELTSLYQGLMRHLQNLDLLADRFSPKAESLKLELDF